MTLVTTPFKKNLKKVCHLFVDRNDNVVPLQCQKKGVKFTPTRGGKNSHVH